MNLCTALLLLLLEEGEQRHTSNLDDLEADTGNVTDSVALTTEPGNQNLIVLLNEVKATVVGDEGGDLLAVLDQLHTGALADGGVGLLGLNTNLLQDNTLGVGGSSQRVGLQPGTQVHLLVSKVGPTIDTAVVTQLASSTNSTRLSRTHLVDCSPM